METQCSLRNGPEPSEYRQRLKIVMIVAMLALGILLVRLWYLQVIKGDELKQRSENNAVRFRKVQPLRGLIMDRNGLVLVDNRPSFDILYMPGRGQNHDQVIQKIQEIYKTKSLDLSIDPSFTKTVRPYLPVRLEKNVGLDKVALVETNALDLPGVYVDVTPVRLYIDGAMMAPIVGYTGEISKGELEKTGDDYSSGDILGKSGLEKVLDAHIRGRRGAELVEVNVYGKEIKNLGSIDPVPGANVVLTIDANLQKATWDAFQGLAGAAVVLNPQNGAILAMVSAPSFDPNIFNSGIPPEEWRKLMTDPFNPLSNRAISGQYPPGSTYKLIVAAAALEEGVVTPETKIFCNGSFDLGNRRYRCWKRDGHGYVDLHRALVVSCDVYFYTLGKLLGVDTIAKYARMFGFGELTGIDLQHERKGLVPTKEWKQMRLREPWQKGETISISIGQGFNLSTPLQLASAYAALANGGTLWRPRLVERIEWPDNKIYKYFPPEKKGELLLNKTTIAFLQKALHAAVNSPGGTGAAARLPHVEVSGKTGTSQVVALPPNEKLHRDRKIAALHKDHALFIAFAPIKHPEIVVAVIAEHAGSGGAVAAPIARKIFHAYFEGKIDAKPSDMALWR
ncbi:MAG: penicillin-binding protein 2, partial [Smithellaceae bacterium]